MLTAKKHSHDDTACSYSHSTDLGRLRRGSRGVVTVEVPLSEASIGLGVGLWGRGPGPMRHKMSIMSSSDTLVHWQREDAQDPSTCTAQGGSVQDSPTSTAHHTRGRSYIMQAKHVDTSAPLAAGSRRVNISVAQVRSVSHHTTLQAASRQLKDVTGSRLCITDMNASIQTTVVYHDLQEEVGWGVSRFADNSVSARLVTLRQAGQVAELDSDQSKPWRDLPVMKTSEMGGAAPKPLEVRMRMPGRRGEVITAVQFGDRAAQRARESRIKTLLTRGFQGFPCGSDA